MLPIRGLLASTSRLSPPAAQIHVRFASHRTKKQRLTPGGVSPPIPTHTKPKPIPTATAPKVDPKILDANRTAAVYAIAGPHASLQTINSVRDWMEDAEFSRHQTRSFGERVNQQRTMLFAFLTRSGAISDLMQGGTLHPRVSSRFALRSFVASLVLASGLVMTGYWAFRRFGTPTPVDAKEAEALPGRYVPPPKPAAPTSVDLIAAKRAEREAKKALPEEKC